MNIRYRLHTENPTMQNKAVDADLGKYLIENFSDGFVIYYMQSNTDIRVLTCDTEGNWSIVRYDGSEAIANAKKDIDKLKVRLYKYKELTGDSNVKKIKFTGDTVYNVKLGTTQEQLLSCIQENISLLDTTRRSVAIPCSGTTPKVGYYYLRFDVQSFGSGAPGKYTLSVRYRNDVAKGAVPTDTVLTTLTVNVISPEFTGDGTYYVERNTSKDDLIGNILGSITVANETYSWTVPYSAAPTAGSYWLEFDSEFDSSGTGDNDYFVKVNYRQSNGDDYTVKTLRVLIDEEEITSSTPPTVKSGIIMRNVGPGAVVQDENGISITFTVNGDNKRYVAVGMLTKDGKLIDTSKQGVHTGLTLTYNGTVICTDFTLEVVANDTALDYPGKGEPGYVGVDKNTTTTPDDFSKTGVANIQLSATGIPKNKGLDLIFILDLSGSMRYKPNTNTYVDEDEYDQTRIVAMQKALLSLVKTMRTSGADIRVAMSDFGDQDHFYFKDAVVDPTIRTTPNFDSDFNNAYTGAETREFFNFRNMVIKDGDIDSRPFVIINRKFNMANPTYTGIVVPTVYTGSHEVGADAFVPVSELTEEAMEGIRATIDENAKKQCGTNYDIGLEYAYHLGYSIQQQNIAEGTDRDIVCIFMSDGAPMQYNYFTGASQSSAWADWIIGEADGITTTVYASEPRYLGELNAISKELLKLLQAGKLVRPEHKRDGASIGPDGKPYFIYRTSKEKEASVTFFDIMHDQGYDLDWDYLCDIAYANGIEDFSDEYYRENPDLSELNALLLDKNNPIELDDSGETVLQYRTKLINPYYYVDQYYDIAEATTSTETATAQFFEAMKSIGVDLTWDLFTEIAEKNRKNLKDSTTDEYAALKKLITRLKTPTGDGIEYGTHSPYTYFYNEEGKNWWAEAIKGDPDKTYHIVNKYAFEDDTNRPYTYNGEAGKQNYYDSGQNLPQDGKDYISGFRGLGIDIYTVSFSVCDDRNLTVAHANQVMQNLASGPSYFYAADSQESLTNAMKAIVSSASTAATQAWYTDTMGENYDLSTEKTVKNENGEYVTVNANPTIKVLEYALDASGNRVEPAIVRETVHFNCAPSDVLENETHNTSVLKAWSDQVYTTTVDADKNIIKTYTNIWNEETGLISGKYFYYNTNTDKSVTLPISNSDNQPFNLAPETFFWIIGTIGKSEIVLEYQVYLTGSIEGTLEIPAGTKQLYDTNESATLHYVNLYGNPCTQDPPSPKQPWGDGVVLTEDTVVIDFGIPVKVDVLYNDYVTAGSTLGGIQAGSTKPADGQGTTTFETTANSRFGSVSFVDNMVKYEPSNMQMFEEDVFTYAVKDNDSQKYYYSTLTVIPATTIYYEDSFLMYNAFTMKEDGDVPIDTEVAKELVWTTVNNTGNAFQDQDRPGEKFDSLDLDANNIYGSDSAYKEMQEYSLGGYNLANVTSQYYGTAKFDFWGTGFDVISVCSKNTGTLMVTVYNKAAFDAAPGNTIAEKMQNQNLDIVAMHMVDTYYGYSYDASTGKWTPITDENAMPPDTYQIPVMKIDELDYGNYTAVITASYHSAFDHNKGDDGYRIYIDAIRIYDPANDGEDSEVVQNAYTSDGEGWPTYYELRNIILDAKTFDALGENDTINGAVFIDGNAALGGEAAISDYTNFGPNNELYLAQDQGICFKLPSDSKIAGVHIAMKKIYSSSIAPSVKIYNVEDDFNAVEPISVNTATDLYYNISTLRHKMIIIYNDSENPVSITNIKITHTQKPEVVKQIKISKRGAAMALASLGSTLPEISDPKATMINKWNIVLGDDIGANFYVEAPKDNTAMAAVKVTVAGQTEIYDLSAMTNADGLYKISVNVAAAQMTEDITLQMVVDGEEYEPVSYTVQDYAKTILAGDYSNATKNLVKHMLNYGAAAQNYFGVNQDNLANAGSEIAYTAQYPAEYPQLAVTGKVSGVRFYGASAVFVSKVALRYYFEAESVEGVAFSVNGVNYPAVEKNGKFYVEVPGIAPSAYADPVVLTAQKDGQQLQVSYSPLTYMVRMSQKGQPELQALMNAMYGYHEAAIAYVEQAN